MAHHYPSMEGVTYAIGRIKAAFKRSDEDTDDLFSIFESSEPPGAGASLHRHPGYVEKFLVLAGRYEFRVGDELLTLVAGDMLSVPRGMPHAFTSLGPDTGRLLTVSTPAGIFEAYLRDVCAAMVDTGKPGGPPAVDFRGISARHGIEFLT
jgi:quercetin dioxygenase-like cupin family protein